MKKLLLKRLIFLIVFFDIAIGITYCLIYNNLPGQIIEDIPKTSDSKNIENIKTVNLNKTYDLNDLKITEYTTILEGANNLTDHLSNTIEYNQDVEISYYQIDGLKDEAIEISINYTLKNDIETKVNEILNSETFLSDLFVNSFKYSNFANTLSIYYQISYVDNNKEYVNLVIPENIDLTTGNKINLNDIILNNSNTRQILSQKLYKPVIQTISDVTEGNTDYEFYGFKVQNYNDVEEEIASVIYNFDNEKNINFVFDAKGIYFLDYYYDFLYKNCINYVTIYDKYSKDYIFDGNYSNLKSIPVLVARTSAEYQLIEEGENFLIDVTLISNFDKYNTLDENTDIKNFVDNKIQDMKNQANENLDIFYVFNCYYEATSYDDNEAYIYENYYDIKTTKQIYENSLKDEILLVQRDYPDEYFGWEYMYGNHFISYLDSEKYNITSNWKSYSYNPSTSEISVYEDNNEEVISWNTID